mgnify:CR=1 FL=1
MGAPGAGFDDLDAGQPSTRVGKKRDTTLAKNETSRKPARAARSEEPTEEADLEEFTDYDLAPAKRVSATVEPDDESEA